MADEQTPVSLPANPSIQELVTLMAAASGVQSERLMSMFTEAMRGQTEAILAAQAPRKIGIGEYDPRTPWHPIKAEAHTLTRPCWQNGHLLDDEQLFNAEIDALNQITRSGRYLDRLVEVIVREEGADETVEIRFASRTADQRNAVQRLCRDFTDMLQQIVAAQQAEDAELIAAGEGRSRRTLYGGQSDLAGVRAAKARRDAAAAAPQLP